MRDCDKEMTNNYEECVSSTKFTCVACCHGGNTNYITHFVDDSTVSCPYCGVDAVLPGSLCDQEISQLNEQCFNNVTVNNTIISRPSILYSTPVNSIGKGWQSGKISGVRFTPNKPAALLMANTLPFGTVSFSIAGLEFKGLEIIGYGDREDFNITSVSTMMTYILEGFQAYNEQPNPPWSE